MKTIIVTVLAIAAGLQSATVLAQDSHGMQGTDDQKHREMMPIHAAMIEKQKAQDAEIDKLLIQMNSAEGEKRIDAIIAVLNKLVEQRKAMQAEMAAHLDK